MHAATGEIVAKRMRRKTSFPYMKDSAFCRFTATGITQNSGSSRKPTGARQPFCCQTIIDEWEGREMSAFIVAPECINCIVTYLNHRSGCFGWLRNALGYDVTQTEELSRLANAFYLMNRTA